MHFSSLFQKRWLTASVFFLVSKFWLSHLKMFSHLKDYDNRLLGYNLFYLFSVSLFPFAVTLVYGFITAMLYKKYYKEQDDNPAIFRLFDAIKKRRTRKKRTPKKLIPKSK